MYKLQRKDNPSQGLWLVGEKIRLGGGEDNEWVLDGVGVNERHAQILIDSGSLTLQGLEGGCCYVNGNPVQDKCTLCANDEIRIGQQRFVVLDSQQVEDSASLANDSKHKVSGGEEQSCWSIVASHPDLKKQNFKIVDHAILGRAKNCDFSIPYKLLSREHAKLTVDDHGLLLTDLDSSNGTFVNGKRIQEARLVDADTIAFAKLSFTVIAPPATQDSVDENQTMIRPMLDLDINREKLEQESAKISLDIDVGAPTELVDSVKEHKMSWRWPVLIIALVTVAMSAVILVTQL